MSNEQPEVPQAAVIKSMDELVFHMIEWHRKGLQQAEHMLQMPEGFEAQFTGVDGVTTKLELSGDNLQAFRFGIMTGIDAFLKLPIAYVEEQKEAANEPTTNTPQGE